MTKSTTKRSVSLALFNVSLLVVILGIVAATARTQTCDCAVCGRKVFVLSYVEQYVGPFKDIPSIHPSCAAFLKERIAPASGMSVSEWLRAKGYYYTDSQMMNLGVGTVKDDFDQSGAGYNNATGKTTYNL